MAQATASRPAKPNLPAIKKQTLPAVPGNELIDLSIVYHGHREELQGLEEFELYVREEMIADFLREHNLNHGQYHLLSKIYAGQLNYKERLHEIIKNQVKNVPRVKELDLRHKKLSKDGDPLGPFCFTIMFVAATVISTILKGRPIPIFVTIIFAFASFFCLILAIRLAKAEKERKLVVNEYSKLSNKLEKQYRADPEAAGGEVAKLQSKWLYTLRRYQQEFKELGER